jgi:hypothetical protein
MGLFSKIKKSLKKIVKKVGGAIKKVAKGIGKVMGKIAKPFAKFGILGQIALSFVMPWAIGGLMSGMGALAGNAFGTFASNMATNAAGNIFTRAAGKLAQGIHYGAAAINKAYTFVSDGIAKGLDWVGQQGAKLKQGITNKFDAAKEWITGTPTYDDALGKELFAGDDIFANVKQTVLDDEALKKQGLDRATVAKELSGISKGGDLVHLAPDAPNLVKTITSKGTNLIGDELVSEIAKDKVTTNLLTAHGNKLMSAGTETAKNVFTLDTAKNEIVKAADAQTAASKPSYEEGPTVSYLPSVEAKAIADYDFSIKSAGGQYMGPADSAIVLDTYKEIMSQYDVRTARAV